MQNSNARKTTTTRHCSCSTRHRSSSHIKAKWALAREQENAIHMRALREKVHTQEPPLTAHEETSKSDMQQMQYGIQKQI